MNLSPSSALARGRTSPADPRDTTPAATRTGRSSPAPDRAEGDATHPPRRAASTGSRSPRRSSPADTPGASQEWSSDVGARASPEARRAALRSDAADFAAAEAASKAALADFRIGDRLHLLPPGFEDSLRSGKLRAELSALRMLMDGPSQAEKVVHRKFFQRTPDLLAILDPKLGKAWRNESSVDEWIDLIDTHLKALRSLRERGVEQLDQLQLGLTLDRRLRLDGEIGEIARIPLGNILLQDMMVLAANERAQFESSGVSRLYRPGDIAAGTPDKSRPLDLKHFVQTTDMLDHVDEVHRQMAADLAAGATPSPVRSRVTFKLSGRHGHSVTAELRTTVRDGMPATALFCIDGSSGPEVAFELKSLMDIAERHDMAALVVNAHTQRSTSDCPIYAMFHAGKLRAMAAGPAFDEMLDRLLENSVNPAAYRLPWGSEHGSRVHYIENDSHPESRLLPPSILKEMQSRKGLQDLVDERQWQSTAVNKKGQTALARYAASYVGVQGQSGRSTSMTDKAIKYFGRARRVLDNVKLLYGRDEGNDLLRQMLGEIRSKGTRNPVTARERMAIVTRQIAACKDNIALLDLARETHEVSHLRYLIDKELISRESDDEDDWSVDSSESIIDEADLPKIKEYAAMTSSELEALDEALLRDQEALRAGFRTREAGSGRFDHMQHTYESNGVTAESEALRLAELQAWLAREHGASIDP